MSDPSIGLVLVLLALLAASGTFSASETALFSLTVEQRAEAPRRVRELLARPADLLVSILLGNLIVNVLFFTLATRVDFLSLLGVGEIQGRRFAAGLPPLVCLLLAGEILPKTFALRSPTFVARVTAAPLQFTVGALTPPARVVVALIEAVRERLGGEEPERHLTPEVLEELLARSAAEGLIEDDEAEMLAEILELGSIRVREIMRPRVDAPFLDLDCEDPEPVLRRALDAGLSWIPVVEGDPDHVLGVVRVRDLLVEPRRPLRQLVMPVKFVPEVASALDLLEELRDDRATEAIVVDEWGGTAGLVTIEDVLEEVVGELRAEGEARERPVVPLGEGRFRVSGALPVREWNDVFDLRIVPTEFETVGGLVVALCGRIPRVGERLRLGNLVLEVREMRGRRVVAVDVWIESPTEEDPA